MVHKRRYKTGPRPGLTCKAVVGGASQRLDDQAWIPPARKPGWRQKKKMAGCVLRTAYKLVRQSLRSRKVMEDWRRKLRRSGYPATMRHEVIKAALDRYKKMCMEEDEGSGQFTAPGAGRKRRGGGRRS